MELVLPTKEQIMERTSGAPELWAGKCHQISMIVRDLMGPEVKVRRGYFIGEVHPDSYFAGRPCQHSWCELPNGQVLDPTRFAFTAEEPWPLWIGPDDDYDIGGCKTALPRHDCPDICDTASELVELKIPSAHYLATLLDAEEMDWDDDPDDPYVMASIEQVMWLANLPVQERERHGVLSHFFAGEVYQAIIDAGHGAAIPIDRRKWILDEPY